jgi:itaconyl-CoA hydratase
VYRSRFGRTVLEADNVWFTLLTLNTNPIHFDAEYAAQTEWERRSSTRRSRSRSSRDCR